jgi:plastocyanin
MAAARRSHRMAMALVIAIVLLATALLAGCGSSVPVGRHGEMHDAMHGGRDARGDEVVEVAGPASVEIRDNSFQLGNLRVTAGTTVTFTNRDPVAHTATADDQSWNTGMLRQGESATISFDEPGIFDYFCIPHPSMRARIEVVP